jgi:hypothetical protein
MNWNSVFYQWFLRELIEALHALEVSGDEGRTTSETVVAPRLNGQYTRDENGRVRFTGRESNLIARPGQSVTIWTLAGDQALGDGTRRRPETWQPRGFVPPNLGLYPDLPRWTDRRAGTQQNHYWGTGAGTLRARALPIMLMTPHPQLLPPAGGITRRRALAHRPRWMDDFWWLAEDVAETNAFTPCLINGVPMFQGLNRPNWMALAQHATSQLPLPIEMAGDPQEPYLHAFPWYRGFADTTAAHEKGTLPYGEGFGIIFFPDKAIKATLQITPPHITIYPGGDFALRSHEYWWQVDGTHQGPTGAESTEQLGMDKGIQVNMHESPLSDFVTVEEVTLPTIRVDPSGTTSPLSSVPATRYTFTPPGVGLNETDKEWLYEGTWSFSRQITVGPSDWVAAPNITYLKATFPNCIPLDTYANETGTTTMRVSGTYTIKAYEAGEESNNGPTEAFLVQPDPLDSDTWYWVNCVIHVGDYVVLDDPNAPILIEPTESEDHNSFAETAQHALVTNVQPETPAHPEYDEWVLTFANVVRRFNPNYRVKPSLFAMPPRYFGDPGDDRIFTVTDEITVKLRVTTLLRPGTAIYGDYGASVETNWIDREYQPDPQTGWFTLMHTPGYEMDFYRRQTVSATGITTVDKNIDFKVAYPIKETELREGIDPEDPVYQHVQLLTPGEMTLAMNRGLVSIGDRQPQYNEAYALWGQNLGRGLFQIRRPPYSWETPDYNYWDPACDPGTIPYVDTVNDWPMVEAVINDGGWHRPIFDPHIHGAGAGDPPEPFCHRPFFRRDRYLLFNGHVTAHIMHPPNITYLETADGVQNPYVRAFHEAIAPTIYEGGGNTLYNPLSRLPGQGGGTWFGITIPTRWYDADAIVMSDGSTVGVVLAWHEDRAGELDEFMLHVSGEEPRPLFHYFPDEISGGAARTPTNVYSQDMGWWPPYAAGTAGAIQVIPTYAFLQPGWPFRTGRIASFVVREAGRGDRAPHTLASAFEGASRVALVV